jgi:HSP20 family protein
MALRRFTSDFTDPFMDMNMISSFANDPFFNRRSLFEPWGMMRGLGGEDFFTPRCDVWDCGNSIRVHADLPGVPKENVSVEIVNGNLQIQGHTSQDQEYDSFDSRVRERRSGTINSNYLGKFSRIMALPPDIDPTKVQAEFKNGVLEMNILKKPESQPKRIKVA